MASALAVLSADPAIVIGVAILIGWLASR